MTMPEPAAAPTAGATESAAPAPATDVDAAATAAEAATAAAPQGAPGIRPGNHFVVRPWHWEGGRWTREVLSKANGQLVLREFSDVRRASQLPIMGWWDVPGVISEYDVPHVQEDTQ